MIASALFVVVCLVLFVVPLFFVAHEVYQDGVFGRGGLLGISFSSAALLMAWWEAPAFPRFPFDAVIAQTVLLAASFALFLCWHLFRFHRRVLRRAV